MSAAESRRGTLILAVFLLIAFQSDIVRSAEVYLSSEQDLDIQCWNSLGRPYFPLLYKSGPSAGGSVQAVGPLFPNQHILCQTGSNATGPSPDACSASYDELASLAAHDCTGSAGNFTLRCPACALVLAVSSPAPAAAGAPYCNGTYMMTYPTGIFTDGAPPGGSYAPGTFCQWIIDPGYKSVRLNITRFDTEANFDFLWILRLDSNGFQDVLQQLSGAFYQVPHSITVPSDRAVVVFSSDGATQASGFAMAWDEGNYCDPQTTLLAPQGTVSDGAPAGKRYRPYTHCEWLIAPGYAPIGLTFTHFSLATNDTLSVYDSETANPTRLIGVYTGVQLPLSLTSGPGDADHIYEINATLTGALLLVFNVADGSTLGGGFSAFYTPINAGDMGTASWGFSRLVSAIIIVSAVVFGLACGTIVGCLLVRLYNMQHGHSGTHARMEERRRWRERLPRFGRLLRWQRQPSVAEQDVLQATGALRSSETLEADMALVQQQVELGDNIDIALVGANGAEVAQQDFLEIGGSGFTRGHGGIGDAQSNPLFEASAALTAGHRPS